MAHTLPESLPRGGATVSEPINKSVFAVFVPTFIQNLSRPPYSKRKIFFCIGVATFVAAGLLFSSLYAFHHGFRRTVQFWKGMGPLMADYKLLKFRKKYLDRWDDQEYKRRLERFRLRTAPKVVNLIQAMGGIYIKIGQVMSTIGQGLLPDEYVQALRPLQDGVTPRDYSQVSKIIEESTGKKMEDIFASFEEKPIGSASIAQAHRATLRLADGSSGERVIVKIQYPEVAKLFHADLGNLELVTRLFMPENIKLVQALRKRHENELDFTMEANNLRECSRNMQTHGLEPALVRIPRVKNETGICTENVLVMEYLQGTSLADAIEQEQDRVAYALGKKDAKELRAMLTDRMRKHFEDGGGPGSGGMELVGGGKAKLIQVAGPTAAMVLRTYAHIRERVRDVGLGLENVGSSLVRTLSGGTLQPPITQRSSRREKRSSTAHVNLGRILKTLVHVHGVQMLLNGVYNADPHPGNVLVLPDGRLGLLDYGMVGRLSTQDREAIAKTVVALSLKDKKETAKLYRDGGYKATWTKGDILDDNVLHRFATFHLDKIDLSPVTLDDGEKMEIMDLFRTTRERVVPSWVEEGRRLGGLLMGVSVQAARPISLSKEWMPIAKQALQQR
jgi:predicted unusual protein kinase regulating ubiquinone biosynthesis (AarF/ABC1/UbiB family)